MADPPVDLEDPAVLQSDRNETPQGIPNAEDEGQDLNATARKQANTTNPEKSQDLC